MSTRNRSGEFEKAITERKQDYPYIRLPIPPEPDAANGRGTEAPTSSQPGKHFDDVHPPVLKPPTEDDPNATIPSHPLMDPHNDMDKYLKPSDNL